MKSAIGTDFFRGNSKRCAIYSGWIFCWRVACSQGTRRKMFRSAGRRLFRQQTPRLEPPTRNKSVLGVFCAITWLVHIWNKQRFPLKNASRTRDRKAQMLRLTSENPASKGKFKIYLRFQIAENCIDNEPRTSLNCRS